MELDAADELKRLADEQKELLSRTQSEFEDILNERIGDPDSSRPMPASNKPPAPFATETSAEQKAIPSKTETSDAATKSSPADTANKER